MIGRKHVVYLDDGGVGYGMDKQRRGGEYRFFYIYEGYLWFPVCSES